MSKLKTSLFLALLVVGCNSSQEKRVTLQTEEDKSFYAVGIMFGDKLKDLQLAPKEMDFLVMGLRDAVSGKKAEVDVAQYQNKVRDIFNDRMKKQSGDNLKKGTEFMEKFLKEEGVKKTASGLAYKMIKEGTGPVPKADETVEVHYHGTLIDGTVFDSSIERKQTVKFPLNRVIRGWTEGLQLVKEGGKIRLVIPSELAYGEHGAPPKIPGGSTLNFEVELVKVVGVEAPAAGPGGPAGEAAAAAVKPKGKEAAKK